MRDEAGRDVDVDIGEEISGEIREKIRDKLRERETGGAAACSIIPA
ncbi:hypothetical protein [uncultured Massilia sp.]|nr:hypothetical protein [uncultured Massilia sp.]